MILYISISPNTTNRDPKYKLKKAFKDTSINIVLIETARYTPIIVPIQIDNIREAQSIIRII